MDSYNKETIRNTYSAGLIHHLTLVVGLVCVGIGQTLLYTILGPASREIGISDFSVGIIVTIAALVITLSSGMWGRLIDRLGSRNAYLAGMIFYTTGTLFLGYGLHISVNHSISALSAFYLLLVIRSLTGFLTAGIHPAAMTYVAESTSSKERGAGIALIASAYGIGSIIGPILGSVIGKVSFLLPILVASAISLLGVILGFLVLKPQKKSLTNKEKERILIRLTDKRVLPIFIGISLTYVGFSCFQQTLSFYVQDVFNLSPERSISKIGGLFATMAIFMIITQLLLIQIIKPSINFLLYCGMWSCVTGFMFLILTTQTFNGLYLACGFLGIGFGMMIPAIQSSASLAVTKDEQGGVSGFLFGASAFGYVIGPALGTYIYSINSNILFLICIVVTFLSVFSTRIVLNKK